MLHALTKGVRHVEGNGDKFMEVRTRVGSIEVDYQTRDYNNLYLGYLYKCGVW